MGASVPLGAYVPGDWDAEGGGIAGAVAVLLRALGYANVFTWPPPARVCCEPIVLSQSSWEREARLADGTERGRMPVDVTVCCESPRDAEATCRAVERDLRRDPRGGSGLRGPGAEGPRRLRAVALGVHADSDGGDRLWRTGLGPGAAWTTAT